LESESNLKKGHSKKSETLSTLLNPLKGSGSEHFPADTRADSEHVELVILWKLVKSV
jgi:hypothetical protein